MTKDRLYEHTWFLRLHQAHVLKCRLRDPHKMIVKGDWVKQEDVEIIDEDINLLEKAKSVIYTDRHTNKELQDA